MRLAEAADGSQALETAWLEQPDIVLLDVGLPKLSGTEVCRALKTNPHAPRVILMSGNTNEVDAAACGADGVIAKPFRLPELVELVSAPAAEAAPAAWRTALHETSVARTSPDAARSA